MNARTMIFILVMLAAFPVAAHGVLSLPYIFFDEYGNCANNLGLITNSGVGQDIGPGGKSNALWFDVPVLTWTPGDVILQDSQGVTSDILRFNSNPYQIVFYSDIEDTEPNPGLADIGFPSLFYTNTVTFTEVALGNGGDGLNYTPIDGQPGYDPGHVGLTYQIQSDAVPEPATMTLLALGALALLRRRAG